ncbi:hypothetical protein, partial [Roseburia faecis]|uniref:hypothetical protein n=1 Tax=Roseburia faecis TaxID=301302 RepID=UPI001A9B3AD2
IHPEGRKKQNNIFTYIITNFDKYTTDFRGNGFIIIFHYISCSITIAFFVKLCKIYQKVTGGDRSCFGTLIRSGTSGKKNI